MFIYIYIHLVRPGHEEAGLPLAEAEAVREEDLPDAPPEQYDWLHYIY